MAAAMSPNNHYKYVSLFALMTQTTVLVLTLRYTRTMKVEGPRYVSSTAIVMAEIIKIFTCLIIIYKDNKKSVRQTIAAINNEAIKKPWDSLKVSVPAILYTVQNNLLFLALTHLDAATYQVTYQLKILTTAMFSVFMLGKKLDGLKWLSLILLTVGVAFVQMPTDDKKNNTSMESDKVSHKLIGFTCVFVACLSSGFSGVYFEKILKGSNTSVWMRNLQLDFDVIRQHGFFQGYSPLIWILVILQAYGGLIIGLVVKYADNILKGFATSLSIILSSILSYFLIGDFDPSFYFLLGASIVIGATVLYAVERKDNTMQIRSSAKL